MRTWCHLPPIPSTLPHPLPFKNHLHKRSEVWGKQRAMEKHSTWLSPLHGLIANATSSRSAHRLTQHPSTLWSWAFCKPLHITTPLHGFEEFWEGKLSRVQSCPSTTFLRLLPGTAQKMSHFLCVVRRREPNWCAGMRVRVHHVP